MYSEDSSIARLNDAFNGRPNLWQKSWSKGSKIRIEWNSSNFIEFQPEADITIARGSQTRIIFLTKFSTSDENLTSYVNLVGEAIFCIAKEDSSDFAWGITWGLKDKHDQYLVLGCTSGNLNGPGAFYGGEHGGRGWTGVLDYQQAKAGSGLNLGITIKIKNLGKCSIILKLLYSEASFMNQIVKSFAIIHLYRILLLDFEDLSNWSSKN